jgi:hypothetical protein
MIGAKRQVKKVTMAATGESGKIDPMRCFFENDQQQTGKHRRGSGYSDEQGVNALFSAVKSGKQPGSAGHSFDRIFISECCRHELLAVGTRCSK